MPTLFLSTVSSEFGMLRRRVANLAQRTKKCYVRHQDDFFHRGVRTLQKLVEEVQESDLVIHLIGAQSGWCIPVDQANAFLDYEKHRDFQSRFPDVSKQAREGILPATQWEAWLGLYFGKRLISFQMETPDLDNLQTEHVERLNKIEEYPKAVANLEAMVDEIFGSLITLGLFTVEEVRLPIHLPYPSIGTLFKGRDEFMEQLRASLRSSTHHRATAIMGKALHGLGGVGKTRLAVEYAWQYADEFSAVLCVTADSPENLNRNLAELTGPMVLDLAEHSATEQEVRVAAALRWLQSHPGWFLILDNVDTEEAVDAVEELLAKLHGGQVLITSRLARFSDMVESLELNVMSPADGATFLLEKTHPKGRRGRRPTATDQADALELAKELDGLALAMEQAGAYIVQMRSTFSDYLSLWRSHKAAVQEWLNRTIQYAGPTNAPVRSVAVTWQTTIDQLGELERRLLDVLAWFAPEPVPLSIFARLTELSQWDADGFDHAISNLADFSMLTWDAELETVMVHRVVQEILRTRQAEPNANLTLAMGLLRKSIPEGNPADVRTWPAWEPLRLHVDSATKHGKRLDIPIPTSFLMGQLGTLLWAKALHREAEPLMRRALAIDEQSYGQDHPSVAIRLNNLAQLLQATNRLAEAEPLMRRALAIDEQSYGQDHPDVAIDLNNLAQLLQATNRLAEAEPLMRRALAIDEQSYGQDHPNVARDLNNLAQLLQATNRLAEAEPLMRRALSIDEQSYGQDHPNVARDLNNLAQLLQATNRLAEAEPLMRRAFAIDEQSYGQDHPNVAIRLNNLAQLLQATNRLADAEPLMRRHVEIFLRFTQATGHPHPNLQNALNNYSQLLQAMGRSETEVLQELNVLLSQYGLSLGGPSRQ